VRETLGVAAGGGNWPPAGVVLDSLLQHAPVGFGFVDRELRYRAVNPALAGMNGLPVAAHLGRTVGEVLGHGAVTIEPLLWRVLATGEPTIEWTAINEPMPAAAGETPSWQVSYYPVPGPDGSPAGVGMVALDTSRLRRVTQDRDAAVAAAQATQRLLERSLERLAQLQQVTARLLATQRVREAAEVATQYAARALDAGFAHAALLDPGTDTYQAVAWVGASPELAATWNKFPNDPALPAGEAIRSRTPVLLTDLTERDRRFPVLAGLPAAHRSHAIMPLFAGDTPVGYLGLGWTQPRHFPPDEVAFLQILAAQCAEALQRAQAYEREHHIAETLQRSLLPGRLPPIPSVDLAARYHPAGAGEGAGGDFYDVFDLAGGRFGVIVGDVSGKGVDAAALTALARHTIRALAQRELSPASVLRGLNHAILADRNDQFCTVAYLVLTPGRDSAQAVCALGGHPQPLLLTEHGDIEAIGTLGTVLGVVGEPRLHDANIVLRAGQRLVLYTDGYLDTPTADGARLDLLHDTLATIPPASSADDLADHLQQRILTAQAGHAHDDMALIILRPTAPAPAPPLPRTPAPGIGEHRQEPAGFARHPNSDQTGSRRRTTRPES
jgi:serine phosphatase RsbU (regulator of sigma subunit)